MTEEPKTVSLTEVKKILTKEEKERELSYEKKLALQHARDFAKLTTTKTKQLISELKKLERVSEYHAYKIADVLPEGPNDVRAIFAKERFNLEPKEISEIVDIVKKYIE
ncbi:MAG: RNA polymerase [Thermoplasmata archaeon]|nr:MAG: RNA polymerase [Thermoplasmata archaeon]